MVLLNTDFEYKVEMKNTDINGNYIILDINIEGKNHFSLPLWTKQ